MRLEELAGKCGEWLRGSGPESDIVVSSRIRLARNLADYPFIRKCTGLDRAAIEKTLRDKFARSPAFETWPTGMSTACRTSIGSFWSNAS